jgi:Family of unknown function (DUF5709)
MVAEQGGWDGPDQGDPNDPERPDEGQLSAGDTLEDRGLDDALDEGYSPPERPRGLAAFGVTAAEAAQGESLDQRIAAEIPDQPLPSRGPWSRSEVDDEAVPAEADEFFDRAEVGDRRAGRLVAPDEGLGPDEDADLYGEDVGIDGGAASAEEAAMHVVEFP